MSTTRLCVSTETEVIETAPSTPTGEVVHYIPHHAVIRDNAETTKMRTVYDCSARENVQTLSLNDCLKTGPSLQPLLVGNMLRNRLRWFCITGDIQKAFLHIRLAEQDKDAQRILWYNNLEERSIVDYRFTRVIFGATSSPYILEATLQKHVTKYQSEYPVTVQSLLRDTYVDDIQGGGETEKEAVIFKEESTKILTEAGFTLHKSHSNVKSLNSDEKNDENGDLTYAINLGVTSDSGKKKLLGFLWNQTQDTFVHLSGIPLGWASYKVQDDISNQ